MASNPVPKLTEEQYLAIERAAEFRSEFLNGEMFAMASGTQQHNRIQGNLYSEIHTLLRGTPCEVFSFDQRLKVPSSGFYTYPDLSVVCGPRDPPTITWMLSSIQLLFVRCSRHPPRFEII